MNWDLISNIILVAAIAVAALFVGLALYQWIKCKSFTKIDPELHCALIPITLMVITYLIFNYVFIWNTRPDGSGEPSFPSTHVMFVATVFALAAIILPKYIKSKATRITLDTIMLALVILVSVARILAVKHWRSDVIAALIFATLFTALYYLLITKVIPSYQTKHKETHHA